LRQAKQNLESGKVITGIAEHREACDQPTLRAEEIEAQVIAFLRSLAHRLPPDWRKRVTDMVVPPEQQTAMEEREQEIRARMERATCLHLDGYITYEQFLEERHRAQAALVESVSRLGQRECSCDLKQGLEGVILPQYVAENSGSTRESGISRFTRSFPIHRHLHTQRWCEGKSSSSRRTTKYNSAPSSALARFAHL